MAILQVSRIQVRQGRQIDLPQLSGGEFGWSNDTRQLFIGNGTLDEGAPVIGNTEILTEFSDIFNIDTAYTYQGRAAGYVVQTGPTPDTPVSMSLQSWADQWASVKDFGAKGDGSTDDTAAINRALQQLYCVAPSVASRRSLFFPAGTYVVSGTVNIPTYATLYGEGVDSTAIVSVSGTPAYVARTADSLQQTGASIGQGGATPPTYITVSNMSFQSLAPTQNIFLVEAATNVSFNGVGFIGPLTTADLTLATNQTAGVRFASTTNLVTSNIVFNQCHYQGTVYGMTTTTPTNSSDQQVNGVVTTNSEFNTLYQAVLMGMTVPIIGTGATGVRLIGNTFDNVYAEAISWGNISLNGTTSNMFYDVGNYFGGVTSPQTAIISVYGDNNIFTGDIFSRPVTQSFGMVPGTSWPPVELNGTTSMATMGGYQQIIGSYNRQSGVYGTLVDNTSSPVVVTSSDNIPCTVDASVTPAFKIDYTVTRGTTTRTGAIRVATNSAGLINWQDDNIENATTGVVLSVSQTGTDVSLEYTTNLLGQSGTIFYSISYFG